MKWLSKRFTLVIIPDANQSVMQYRISRLILILVPVVILLLGILALLFFLLFSRNALITSKLQNQLTSSAAQYQLQLNVKEENINLLQTDLVQLSEQAQAMEQKMAQINELELQLKQLAGIETYSSTAAASKLITEEGGQGGEELPLPVAGSASFAKETSQHYSDITHQMDELIPQLEETKKEVMKVQQMLRITPTIWPTDSRKVTSLFGVRKDPFTRRATYHAGLDIGGAVGDPIYAAADGTVTRSERDRIHGNNVMIDHGRGISTRYMHMNARNVEVGDKVVKGQIIGQLGNTGRSTGPHLHYEVFVNGENVDPEPYIKGDREEP
ncbi:murein DD-endopeptidase MepM/ murein hydrolase activator NlpD [Paenibacillus castaneae]|uniref:M23 family metallopeptidase n=1 Tax=Paenibacillus castaneae TaxID=474957 RepID=UPI000C9ADBAD|nr:M23 family metallopeptidase [Paenibacillus castaneae]NIK78964.1 murein DD-endopeptidase MepM/ murein hydrolase activator NlpD [Paenibacillus castaneae]